MEEAVKPKMHPFKEMKKRIREMEEYIEAIDNRVECLVMSSEKCRKCIEELHNGERAMQAVCENIQSAVSTLQDSHNGLADQVHSIGSIERKLYLVNRGLEQANNTINYLSICLIILLIIQFYNFFLR